MVKSSTVWALIFAVVYATGVSMIVSSVTSACGGSVPVTAGGNIMCSYKGKTFFRGHISLDGDGLDAFKQELTNRAWTLCTLDDPDERVRCSVLIDSSTVAAR